MPLEFALRPRIRLAEGFAPPRRSRWRVPKLALPVAAYWLTVAAITYGLIHLHDQPGASARAPVAAVEPAAVTPLWSRPAPTAPTAATTATTREPESPPVAPEGPAAGPAVTSEEAPPIANEAPVEADSTLPTPRARPGLGEASDRTSHEPLALAAHPGASSVLDRDQPATDDGSGPPSEQPSEPKPNRDAPALLGATPPDAPAAVASALPSCQAAAAAANQEIDLSQRDPTPDLSRDAIASVLDNGVWIARCDIPMSTSIELCVAIKGGRVIGASVSSRPASAAIEACVKRRAAGLHFPYSARVDVAKTRF